MTDKTDPPHGVDVSSEQEHRQSDVENQGRCADNKLRQYGVAEFIRAFSNLFSVYYKINGTNLQIDFQNH